MAGLEVFMRNLPPGMTDLGLTTQLKPIITDRLHISNWTCQKPRGKGFGTVTFLHRADGETFLRVHGELPVQGYSRNGFPKMQARLAFLNTYVYCKESHNVPDTFSLKNLIKEVEDRSRQEEEPQNTRQDARVVFDIYGISCGHYEYPNNTLSYARDIEWRSKGIAKFARESLIITFRAPACSTNIRVEMPYRTIHEVVICMRPPSLVLTLWEAPRLFKVPGQVDAQDLPGMLAGMNLSQPVNQVNEAQRIRLSEIPHRSAPHKEILGQSLVYCITLSPVDFSRKVGLLRDKEHLTFSNYNFPNELNGNGYMIDEMRALKRVLNECSTMMPFDVLFQFQALVQNGYLLPSTVTTMLSNLRTVLIKRTADAHDVSNSKGANSSRLAHFPFSAGAVRKLFSQIPFPGPNVEASTFSITDLWTCLRDNEDEIRQGIGKALISERAKQNLTMVYKVQVTPTRILLTGPEPEAKNRILRKYPNHTGHFARVQFCDEDGQDLFFNTKISLDEIYQRFKDVLLRGIPIAGRMYQFLGFSHSSLRAHAVWFMAAFYDENSRQQAYADVIGTLGTFTSIYSPARCAARIGQAFSETPFSVNLESLRVHVEEIEDVKSKDQQRVFSDGVGTISVELMEAIHEQIPLKRSPPTCFQIRWGGAKGMLSLDPTLPGMVMCIRPESMVKFESQDKQNLEICDVANKPIPLVLNRQMIKILEDMGVPDQWFFRVQNRELSRLRKITAQVDNTVTFLRRQKIADQIRFPQFIRRLHKLGFDYRRDKFLCSVVEAVVLREVRLLKHKARIPIENGVTLFGIMDEFAYLEEDEVYVTFDKPKGAQSLNLHDRAVLVTRSPALHPGDIQIRTAVVPPHGHPLRELSNCIVFSQKGRRDLPSQLSGGDLDGDIYNIIWDTEAVDESKREFEPADYPRVSPVNIGRPVTAEDMTNFFVDFMATDQLGVIAIRHLILSDMHLAGTVHEECKTLAHMHSTGVDYSKTGIPINMNEMKKLTRTRFRPDFLASAPPASIVNRTEITFDLPVAPSADDDEDDDTGPNYRYYYSEKILGKLYRAVDENKIWKDNIHLTVDRSGASIWEKLLAYIHEKCETLGDVNWQQAITEAYGLRRAYEDEIWSATMDHSDHYSSGITELEVFTGSIFNKTGVQTRRQRDTSTKLKDEFNRISKWIESLICRHEVKPPRDDDNDEQEEQAGQQELEEVGTTAIHPSQAAGSSALELSIACLHVGMEKPPGKASSTSRRGEAEFQSFKVVAAHCALRELESAVGRAEIETGATVLGAGYAGAKPGYF